MLIFINHHFKICIFDICMCHPDPSTHLSSCPWPLPLRHPTGIFNLSCQKHNALCFLSKIASLSYSPFRNDVPFLSSLSSKPQPSLVALFPPLALHLQSGSKFISPSSFTPHDHLLSISSAPSVQHFLPLSQTLSLSPPRPPPPPPPPPQSLTQWDQMTIPEA